MISPNFSSDMFLIRSGYITETGVIKHTYDVFYHNTPKSTSFLFFNHEYKITAPWWYGEVFPFPFTEAQSTSRLRYSNSIFLNVFFSKYFLAHYGFIDRTAEEGDRNSGGSRPVLIGGPGCGRLFC